MGWSNGSSILVDVIEAIEEHASSDCDKVAMFERIITAFEDADCDTTGECLAQSPAFDEAYAQLHPDDDDWLDSQTEPDAFDAIGEMAD